MGHRTLRFALFAGLSMGLVLPVPAEYVNPDPAAACDLLKSERLRTQGGYISIGKDLYRCSSRPKKLMAGDQVMHTIKYYATGTEDAVTELTLKLDVQTLSENQRAHRYLLQYTEALFKNALDQEVPKAVQDAILAGTNGQWQVGDVEVEVRKAQIRATAYELLVTLR